MRTIRATATFTTDVVIESPEDEVESSVMASAMAAARRLIGSGSSSSQTVTLTVRPACETVSSGTRRCDNCGRTFAPSYADQRFCSDVCAACG